MISKARLVAPRSLGILATLVISALVLAHPETSLAQGDGGWNGPTSDAAALTTRIVKISGCWSGTTDDQGFGAGTLVFDVKENAHAIVVKHNSRFNFEWPNG